MSIEIVEKTMASIEGMLLNTVDTDVDVLDEASKHIISSGGKRVRPRLVLLSHLACGGDDVVGVADLGAAVELVHTATLVHDDINDHSDFRRGKVAVHARWGRTFALLTGDFLFTKVYELMAPFGNPYNVMMSHACVKLVEGETLQAQAAKSGDIDRETYKTIIARKTASLFEVATMMGAASAGANEETIESMRVYGYNLGMAFQLIDDVLDVVGNAAELGKPVGLDVAQGRGVVVAEGHANGNGSAAVAAPVLAADDPAVQLMQKMMESGAIELARMQAIEMGNRARQALADIPESIAKDELFGLIDLVLDRSN